MIPETPNLQRKVSSGEERYTNLIKNTFIIHAKEINRLDKSIEEMKKTYPDMDLSGYYTKQQTENKIQEFIQQELSGFNPATNIPTKLSQLLNDTGYLSYVTWGMIEDKPDKFPPTTHTHTWDSIQNKPNTFPPSFHEHQDYLTEVDWEDVQNKPDTYPPSLHYHPQYLESVGWDDIEDKPSTFPPSEHTHSQYLTSVSWGDVSNKPTFATVATSGSYSDLSNKPTIPTIPANISAFTNDVGYITGVNWDDIGQKPNTFPPSTHTHQEYLPLSGGTLNGHLHTSGHIYKTSDTGILSLNGGNGGNNGAYLNLYGKDNETAAGAFSLAANNGTTRKQLIGYTDGTLTWDGTAISLNGHTHSYLPLSGGTLTGSVYTSGLFNFEANHAKGTNPSAWREQSVRFADNSGEASDAHLLGILRNEVGTDGTVITRLVAYKNAASSSTNAGIGITYPASGDPYAWTVTPPANSNSTVIPTTAWVNTKLSGYSTTSHTHSYLPLSGGTMTGAITTSAVDFIKRNVNNNHLTILGGTEYGNSASLYLTGGDTSSNAGSFQLRAQAGSGSKDLVGKPDGTLTWGGTAISLNGHTHSYLPLSGGTMTGLIKKNGNVIYADDNSFTRFMGGSTDAKGASLTLGGSTHSWAGKWELKAHDGTNAKVLVGTAGGTLTWGGTAISLSGHTHGAFVKSGSTAAAGFVPAPSTTAGTTKYLREDCSWQVPPNNAVTKTSVTFPASSTNYYLVADSTEATATGGLSKFGTNARLQIKAGTTSVEGISEIILGNAIAEGTANNVTGQLCLYNDSGKYHIIAPHSGDTTNRTVYTPKSGGTLVCHTTDTAVGSSSKPVYINANGVATACTYSLGSMSNAQNGYVVLPSGIIINWGKYVHSSATTSANQTITFPKAYATACYSVVFGLGGNRMTTNFSMSWIQATAITKTDFTVGSVSSKYPLYWMAIGI